MASHWLCLARCAVQPGLFGRVRVAGQKVLFEGELAAPSHAQHSGTSGRCSCSSLQMASTVNRASRVAPTLS